MTTDKNAMVLYVRVVEAGSFSKAAAREGVPVSTVSRKIAELEKALGVRLLERSTRQLRMTEIGQDYEQLLNKYEHALNTGDVNAAVQLYTEDGVFMAPENLPAVGTHVLREAYAGVFQAIALKLKFQIAEAKLLSPEWALLRTTSSGTVKIVANGAEIPGSNQELFLLRKTSGQWKIARYGFSSVLPRAK